MKIANKKFSNLQIIRFIIQIVFFVLLPGMYINAFSGIRQIYTGIIQHTFSFAQYYPQMIEAIAIVPVTILLGRFFCGWMCAFGTMGDIIHHISSKVFKVSFRISEKADRVLKYFKYVLLGFLILIVWSFGLNLSGTNPWDAFGVLATIGKMPDVSYAFTEFTVGSIILVLIVIGSFFIERFFCRYLCPLGAVFAIVSRLKLVKISKTRDKCGACKICTKSCAMGIPLYKYDKVESGECINCLKCIPACPRKNISESIADTDVRPAIASALAVAVITGTYCAGTLVADGAGMNTSTSLAAQASTAANESKYADGTYEGSGSGFRGATTTVSVTVKNGVISDIQALSYGDDTPYFNRAYNSVVSEILSTQSTDVDAVSGATFSSNGIMEAVQDALTNASLTAQVSASSDTAAQSQESTVDEVQASSESTEAAASSSAAGTTEKTANATGNVSAVTPADNSAGTTTEKSSQNTSAAASSSSDTKKAASSKYKDGTYEGSAQGFRRGITTVSVTVKNDKITDVQVVSHGDDDPFFNRAYDSVISEILSTQSTDVDAVSGATYSSNGIMNAVADALSSAEA